MDCTFRKSCLMWTRRLAACGAFLACSLLLLPSGCSKKPAPPLPPPPSVTVVQPVRETVTEHLEFTGNTQASNTVQLRARVAGYLDKVLFRDGDYVRKGQALFIIQRNTYEANLHQAEAAVSLQKTQLDYAGRELARYSALLEQNAAAQTDVDNWRYQRDSAQANLSNARARLELAQLDLGYTEVQAPFDGRVDRTLVDRGNLVGSGEPTVLAQLSQLNPIYVYFNVSDADLARVKSEGLSLIDRIQSRMRPVFAGLPGEDGYPHRGYLDFASVSVAPTAGTLLIRGVLPNPRGDILPGLYARVRVPIRERPSLLVPSEAVDYEQRGGHIKIVDENNKVQERYVTVGVAFDNMIVIEKGLQGNEWVIIKGLQKAIPGRIVTPVRQRLWQGAEEDQAQSPQQQPSRTGS